MRITGFLLLFFIITFSAHYVFQNRKLDKVYADSVKQMPADIAQAINTFKPALKIKDLDTFGKAGDIHRQWCQQLVKSTIDYLNKPTFTKADEENVIAALQELKKTEILTEQEKLKAHEEIFQQVKPTAQTLAETGLLPDFDNFVAFLDRLQKEPILKLPLPGQVPDLLAKAQQIDRYPIALRTVRFHATQAMKDGFNYLKIDIPQTPGVIQMSEAMDVSAWDPGPAESSFLRAQRLAQEFIAQWKTEPPPADVVRIPAVSGFNMAMIRLAYSMNTARDNSEGRWGLYFIPEYVIPEVEESQHRWNYQLGIRQGFQTVLEWSKSMPPDDPVTGPMIAASQAALQVAPNLDVSGIIKPFKFRVIFLW